MGQFNGLAVGLQHGANSAANDQKRGTKAQGTHFGKLDRGGGGDIGHDVLLSMNTGCDAGG